MAVISASQQIVQVFVSGRELTEVSQAGQSGGLQPAVVGEGVAGSDRDPLDAVQHQDAVVALCGATRETKPAFRPRLLASYVGEIFPSEWMKAITHRPGALIDWSNSLISESHLTVTQAGNNPV